MREFQRFLATQILRKIKCWDSRSSTNCHFDLFEAKNLDIVGFFFIFRGLKFAQKQNSEPLKVQKWQFLNG